MSRSCQRATFSSPTSAAARTTRASPQIRSATTGLRLCGIAEEPFWPLPNGSCTSATSVRARWRISTREALQRGRGDRERGEQLRVAVALDDLRRGRLGLEAEPLAGDALDLRVDRRVVADRAGELADPHAFERRARRGPVPRSSSNAQTASLRPNVVGSAWTPCVRPIVSVSRCSSARATTASNARSMPSRISSPAAPQLQRERRVDDVRGGQAVVEPAARPRRARSRPRRRTPRGRDASSPRSPRRARESGVCAPARIAVGGLRRHDADLGPAVERGELDLEPALELALVRPDPGHGRAGVARDHCSIVETDPAGTRRPGRGSARRGSRRCASRRPRRTPRARRAASARSRAARRARRRRSSTSAAARRSPAGRCRRRRRPAAQPPCPRRR